MIANHSHELGSSAETETLKGHIPVSKWPANQGLQVNGIDYGCPQGATSWGHNGCPLLPEAFRQALVRDGIFETKPDIFKGIKIEAEFLNINVLEQGPDQDNISSLLSTARSLADKIEIPKNWILLPEGIPVDWLMALPLSPRARNSVLRVFRKHAKGPTLEHPVAARDFVKVRGVGGRTLVELACVMESITNGSNSAADRIKAAENIQKLVKQAVERPPEIEGSLRWHATNLISRWLSGLSERDRDIFLARTSSGEGKHTLTELGRKYLVTRERIRQLNSETQRMFREFIESPDGLAVKVEAEMLRREIGPAHPVAPVDEYLGNLEIPEYGDILLTLAGPYLREDDWYVDQDRAQDDPQQWIERETGEGRVIDEHLATNLLSEWGLVSALHEKWMTRNGKIRRHRGRLVIWGQNMADRVDYALLTNGAPMTVDEIRDFLQETTQKSSTLNALRRDPRFVRQSKDKWALKSWNVVEYTSTHAHMLEVLQEAGGRMKAKDLNRILFERFDVAPSTSKAYSYAPTFLIEGPYISIRDFEKNPYTFPEGLLEKTPGVFRTGGGTAAYFTPVSERMLRGSGSMIPMVAIQILGIEVDEKREFFDQQRNSYVVSFPSTNIGGSYISTIRKFLNQEGAVEGDFVTIVLNRDTSAVEFILTRGDKPHSWLEILKNATGITESISLEKLAMMINCDRSEVINRLVERGDQKIVVEAARELTLTETAIFASQPV